MPNMKEKGVKACLSKHIYSRSSIYHRYCTRRSCMSLRKHFYEMFETYRKTHEDLGIDIVSYLDDGLGFGPDVFTNCDFVRD